MRTRMVIAAALALPALSACGMDYYNDAPTPLFDDTASTVADDSAVEGDADTDADSDADTDSDSDSDIQITGVTPEYGTTAGGDTVTIIGGPFDNSATVRFGGTQATVNQVQSTSLTVTTPSFPSADAYDVSVSQGSSSATLTGAFTVLEDGSNLAGAIGELAWINYVGGYWSSEPQDEGFFWWTLIEPTDFYYRQFFATGTGSCVSEYVSTADLFTIDLGLSSTTISSGSTSLTAAWDGSSTFDTTYTSSSKFLQNATYSMSSVSPSNGWPSFDVSSMVSTPSSISVTSPAIQGQNLPDLNRSNFRITWTGGGSADWVVIQLGLRNQDQTATVETVTCVAPNNGSFQVPSSVWNSWASGRVMVVLVGAYTEGTGIIGPNNSVARVAGVYFMYGGGWTI